MKNYLLAVVLIVNLIALDSCAMHGNIILPGGGPTPHTHNVHLPQQLLNILNEARKKIDKKEEITSHLQIASTLIQQGASANSEVEVHQKTSLCLPFVHYYCNYPEIVQFLKENGADVNRVVAGKNWSPLHVLMMMPDIRPCALTYWLNAKADINKQDNTLNTPLMYFLYDRNLSKYDWQTFVQALESKKKILQLLIVGNRMVHPISTTYFALLPVDIRKDFIKKFQLPIIDLTLKNNDDKTLSDLVYAFPWYITKTSNVAQVWKINSAYAELCDLLQEPKRRTQSSGCALS